MSKIILSLLGACLVSGCVADGGTRVPLALNGLAMMEMDSTTSVLKKRNVASATCRKAGYARKSDPYYDCMRALVARDLQRITERADVLLQHAANRHGVCMERATYSVARCLEI